MACCTEREAINLGVFYLKSQERLIGLVKDKEAYNKLTAGNPTMTRKLGHIESGASWLALIVA